MNYFRFLALTLFLTVIVAPSKYVLTAPRINFAVTERNNTPYKYSWDGNCPGAVMNCSFLASVPGTAVPSLEILKLDGLVDCGLGAVVEEYRIPRLGDVDPEGHGFVKLE